MLKIILEQIKTINIDTLSKSPMLRSSCKMIDLYKIPDDEFINNIQKMYEVYGPMIFKMYSTIILFINIYTNACNLDNDKMDKLQTVAKMVKGVIIDTSSLLKNKRDNNSTSVYKRRIIDNFTNNINDYTKILNNPAVLFTAFQQNNNLLQKKLGDIRKSRKPLFDKENMNKLVNLFTNSDFIANVKIIINQLNNMNMVELSKSTQLKNTCKIIDLNNAVNNYMPFNKNSINIVQKIYQIYGPLIFTMYSTSLSLVNMYVKVCNFNVKKIETLQKIAKIVRGVIINTSDTLEFDMSDKKIQKPKQKYEADKGIKGVKDVKSSMSYNKIQKQKQKPKSEADKGVKDVTSSIFNASNIFKFDLPDDKIQKIKYKDIKSDKNEISPIIIILFVCIIFIIFDIYKKYILNDD